jgi:hypothetical protein
LSWSLRGDQIWKTPNNNKKRTLETLMIRAACKWTTIRNLFRNQLQPICAFGAKYECDASGRIKHGLIHQDGNLTFPAFRKSTGRVARQNLKLPAEEITPALGTAASSAAITDLFSI